MSSFASVLPQQYYFKRLHFLKLDWLHLADRGIIAPRDISLVVADQDPSFVWSKPIPSNIQWDYRLVVRRIVRWAKNVAAGNEDIRKIGNESEFIEGGTIGPAPRT
jgi:hypothetical protein